MINESTYRERIDALILKMYRAPVQDSTAQVFRLPHAGGRPMWKLSNGIFYGITAVVGWKWAADDLRPRCMQLANELWKILLKEERGYSPLIKWSIK